LLLSHQNGVEPESRHLARGARWLVDQYRQQSPRRASQQQPTRQQEQQQGFSGGGVFRITFRLPYFGTPMPPVYGLADGAGT